MSIITLPLVSVIVPIYNVENYLKKCIDSILCQTYSNLEIILVNDGSTDNSLEICNSYKDDRIIILNKENGGLSSARNSGLEVMTGEYIFFLDSDDWIEDNCIEYLMNVLLDTKVDMVQCGFLPTSDESCTIVNTEEQIQIYDNIEALYLFHDKVNTITWNKLYSASLFSYIRFPNGKIHEDHFTTYKVVYESKKIAVTNQTLIFYRERPNSIMTSKYSKKRLDIVLATEEKLNFMKILGDKGLYNFAIKEHEYTIIASYEMHKKFLPKDTQSLNMLINKYHQLYPVILKSDLGLFLKIKSTIFYYSPTIFNKLKSIIR